MEIEKEKLKKAIQEVGREIGLRRNFYPKWIQSGRLTVEKSNEQINNMVYAYEVLKSLGAENVENN